jgi:hypothetical protein
MVRTFIRLEGLVVLLISLYAYRYFGASWAWFFALFLAPDLSMAGYLKGKQAGALTYNLVHTYILAAVLLAYGWAANSTILTSFGLILAAHIGADRVLGLGLKYPTNFKDTHIQRL